MDEKKPLSFKNLSLKSKVPKSERIPVLHTPTKEKRIEQRFPLIVQIQIKLKDTVYEFESVNISASGMKLKSSPHITTVFCDRPTELTLSYTSNKKSYKFPVKVTFSQKNPLSLKFDTDSTRLIGRFLAEITGD